MTTETVKMIKDIRGKFSSDDACARYFARLIRCPIAETRKLVAEGLAIQGPAVYLSRNGARKLVSSVV